MGYQTGTSTGPNDLIDKLRLFLISEGWSVNGWTTDGTGYRLHVQKSAASGGPEMYFNFRSAVQEYNTGITEDNTTLQAAGEITGLIINGSTGYNGSADWDKQPGYSKNGSNESYGCCIHETSVSAIPAYYFFSVGNTVNVVVEVVAGKFQFMSFGCLEKSGVYTGGMFFTASISSGAPNYDWDAYSYAYHASRYMSPNVSANSDRIHGAVYVDVDGYANWRRCSDSAAGSASQGIYVAFTCPSGQSSGNYDTETCRGITSMFWYKGPNFYNNISAGCPAYVFVKRSDLNYSLLGWPAGVRVLNFQNYSTGQEVTYGSDTWKIFMDDGINADPNNENVAFAFLKEV